MVIGRAEKVKREIVDVLRTNCRSIAHCTARKGMKVVSFGQTMMRKETQVPAFGDLDLTRGICRDG